VDRPPAIALLGLGEAGAEIARDLVAAGADVRGYDPRVTAPPGVLPRADEAAAVADADLVLSVNSAADAPVALRNALPGLRAGTVWADLNTAAPAVKRDLAAALAGRDVPVADVALLATVPGRGLRTPMLVSGDGAVRYARVLAGFGVTVDLLEGPPGAAISRKLLRSVFWKGVAAAVVEAMEGAEAGGGRRLAACRHRRGAGPLHRRRRRRVRRRVAPARPPPVRRDGGRRRAVARPRRATEGRRGRPGLARRPRRPGSRAGRLSPPSA
jgi:3-hydroxyisobutyrate dehydrogenase-like beta-hydroxyacid dehydrogenase